ncbi:hypothetical protein Syun_018296 [Stephania yunnanensis]|uniref:Uncharacterized protein n=1 Tax=Stephania yunnanensis TaxID=152371 RepID=A0AAP0IS39_9MAGN
MLVKVPAPSKAPRQLLGKGSETISILMDLDTEKIGASQARKKLVDALLDILSARRAERVTAAPQAKQDMTDALIDAEDEKGQKLNDEEIINILIMYLMLAMNL